MAWLSGYNKRIKVTADHTKVGSNLSWFPLTIFLKSGDGDTTKIFDELGSNNLKMAITKSDGTTQLYVEIEQWDTTNKVGVLHCGRDGDTLSSSADTDYYIYYDSSHADNTDYVGVKNSTPAQSVWDGNFKAIYHMSDGADTSHIYDSTSNNNDGTKKAANEPTQADGQIAKAQSFDGTDDKILTDLDPSTELEQTITIEAWVYPHAQSNYRGIMGEHIGAGSFAGIIGFQYEDGYWAFGYGNGKTFPMNKNIGALTLNSWVYLVGTITAGTGGNINVFKDGTQVGNPFSVSTSISHTSVFNIGRAYDMAGRYFDGIIDEVRISNVARSAAWIKATYNSLNDSLLTYGAEETNANFFPFF